MVCTQSPQDVVSVEVRVDAIVVVAVAGVVVGVEAVALAATVQSP